MNLLNYIYFPLFIALYCWFLSKQRFLREDPFHPGKYVFFTGQETLWMFIFTTGIIAISSPAGMDLMALRLMILELLLIVCIYKNPRTPIINFPCFCYIIYLAWLCISLSYSPAPSYGIRVILKYLYPLLILMAASTIVRHEEVFYLACKNARLIALVSIAAAFIPRVDELIFPGVFWYSTAKAINYIAMTSISLGFYLYLGRQRKDLLLAVVFVLPAIFWVFRTSILGTLVALSTMAIFKYRLKAIPVLAFIAILGVASVFCITPVKTKMFHSPDVTLGMVIRGEVKKDDINSNARFGMWEYFLNKFYTGKELRGSGIGTVQHHFYTNNLFGGLKVIHGDWVQMKCDTGLVGYGLYYGSLLCIILHSFLVYNTTRSKWVKLCAFAAAGSMAGIMTTTYSDNVVNYSMCTFAYPFGLYGMMLGLMRARENKKLLES